MMEAVVAYDTLTYFLRGYMTSLKLVPYKQASLSYIIKFHAGNISGIGGKEP